MNKQKLEKIFIIALCSILLAGIGVLAFLLVRKFNSMETIAKEEYKYQADYKGVSSYEHDADIHIDGVLDEKVWENKKWYTDSMLNNMDGTYPTLAMTGFSTEYGIYIASKVDDENLLNDNMTSFAKNSSWDFYVTADNVGEERTMDGLYTKRFVIDMLGYVSSTDPFVETAVVVDGELNSAETKGATLEMFIPWSTVDGIDTEKGIPTEFRLLPNYNYFVDGEDVSRQIGGGISVDMTWDYFRFNQDGYMTADREGAIVGDAKSGYAKTANWDISKEEEGILRPTKGGGARYIYFKEEYGPNYIVETTIVPINGFNNDKWPKAGIIFASADYQWFTYHSVLLDMQEAVLVDSVNGTKNFGKYMLVTLDNYVSAWNQVSLSKYNSDNVNASKREGVKLTVMKYGSKFFYFVDGKFVTSEEKDFLSGDVFPGFYSMQADVIYKDYSCKKLEKAELQSILNKQKVYFIDAKATNAGGTVKTSIVSANPGDDCAVTITSRTGYAVSSILVNGKEKIQDAKKNAKDGVYTISNINRNYDIEVSFEKTGEYDLTGILQDVPANSAAQVVVTGVDNKIFRCETDIVKNNKFKVSVPKGKYQIEVTVEGYTVLRQQITINKNKEIKCNFKLSDFSPTVQVNDKTVNSNIKNWNLSEEFNGKISSSNELGGAGKPLYFKDPAQNFAVEATIKYTTDFKSGVDYQPDLFGGFYFSDGANTGWIAANKQGLCVNWNWIPRLVDYNVLTYPEKRPVKFAIAKMDNEVYVYMDDRLVHQMKWSDICPKISADTKVAIGLFMFTSNTADIEFSNYKVDIGHQAASKYVKDHATKDVLIPGNPDFAKDLNINGRLLNSGTAYWNTNDVSKGIVTATETAKMKPLYFAKHGSTVILETYIEYTTDFKAGVQYQTDLMGGFAFSDGKTTGYLMARQNGLVYTDYKVVSNLIDHHVLFTTNGRIPVKLTAVLKDNYIYAFLDDKYVFKTKVSSVVPNVANNADLAFGLMMIADKKADIKFSNISISTDVKTVDTYLNQYKK